MSVGQRKHMRLSVLVCLGSVVCICMFGTLNEVSTVGSLSVSTRTLAINRLPLLPYNDTANLLDIINSYKIDNAEMNKQKIQHLQNATNGAFIHLGKTGGSTLSLQLRNGCHSFVKHPCRAVSNETIASKKISKYYHVPDFWRLPETNHDFYVMTLRDPFDRTLSAFVYEHSLNRKARGERVRPKHVSLFSCFSTLETFVSLLDFNHDEFKYPFAIDHVDTTSCQDLARAAFNSRVSEFAHLFTNHLRLKELMPNSTSPLILATRQEHIWDDWREVNVLLGQQRQSIYVPATRIRDFKTMEKANKLPVSRDLSGPRQQMLCKALESEYKAYFWFLSQAYNIRSQDVLEAYNKALNRCPNLVPNAVLPTRSR